MKFHEVRAAFSRNLVIIRYYTSKTIERYSSNQGKLRRVSRQNKMIQYIRNDLKKIIFSKRMTLILIKRKYRDTTLKSHR